MSTQQSLNDLRMTEFIFMTRPKEVAGFTEISDTQKKKIEESYRSNPERVSKSMSVVAAVGDAIVQSKVSGPSVKRNKS